MRRKVHNPPNPWHRERVELDVEAPQAELHVTEVDAKAILSRNDSPDLSFDFSLNPYQGCYHGCSYCYARPSHQYLGYGAGTDFERKLLVKRNAPELLRAAFMRRSWRGDSVLFSGNTDCYQPLEATFELTRACLRVCQEFRNPIALISKGRVLRRDVPLLGELARQTSVRVWISIPFVQEKLQRAFEPFAATPGHRLETLRQLAEGGVPVGIAVAPIIPGLNDSDVIPLLEQAAARGADAAFMTPVRLPAEVKDVFQHRLAEVAPGRVDKVMNAIRAMRQGQLNEPCFGARFGGHGARHAMIRQTFETTCRRLGLHVGEDRVPSDLSTFRRPTRQLGLF